MLRFYSSQFKTVSDKALFILAINLILIGIYYIFLWDLCFNYLPYVSLVGKCDSLVCLLLSKVLTEFGLRVGCAAEICQRCCYSYCSSTEMDLSTRCTFKF